MKPLRFVVEWVGNVRAHRVVLARQIDHGPFHQHDGLKLGGRRVLSFDIPRAIAPNWLPRLDLVAFTLGAEEGEEMREGASVELTGTA